MDGLVQDRETRQRCINQDRWFREPSHLLPLDEMHTRLEHAKTLESFVQDGGQTPDFRLRAEYVAALMTSPLSVLEHEEMLSPKEWSISEIEKNLNSIAPYCKHYLQHLGNRQDIDFHFNRKPTKESIAIAEVYAQYWAEHEAQCESVQSSLGKETDTDEQPQNDLDSGSNPEAQKPDDHLRDRNEKARCLKRDGNVCVVTGTAEPEAYHIVPFTWNDTYEHTERTALLDRGSACILEPDLDMRTSYLADSDELGASDKAWNMICLNPELHY
ncbi:hypothetical protein FSARC_4823 [Fusarium sarcochroum]|uniref:HNH nuclease domain-containing protein n=1 Tax=Fusarium sarcochroum TaxID=1208366 RepID=A0A8H4U0W0_9HYPO|nr:hypothetical protein FSARC_4823 [Fusarium sarcochroum]